MPLVIVVAVDGSAMSRNAARYAADNLALGEVDHDLRLIHVLYRIPPRAASVVGRDIVEGYYRSEMDEALKPALGVLENRKLHYQTVRRIGNPGPEIARYVQAEGVDLLVMGTHGRGAAKGLLLGSTAQSIIADSDVPVLLLRGEIAGARSGEILLAVDGSAYTRRAVAYFLRHRGLLGSNARLTLLHVSATLSRFAFARKKSLEREVLKSEYEQAMRPARRLLTRAKVTWREVHAHGEPGEQIATYARQHDCDLIVMGSHGRGGMTSLLLGSVVQKTLNACRTPILIVRK